MNNIIVENIHSGNYAKAFGLLNAEQESDIKNFIIDYAYSSESIDAYSFVRYASDRTNKKFWIELAIELLLNPLCFVEGAYSTALFHTRELLERDRSVINLEQLLYFYKIPEKLVSRDEAESIAIEILKRNPQSKIASSVMK